MFGIIRLRQKSRAGRLLSEIGGDIGPEVRWIPTSISYGLKQFVNEQ